MNFINLTPHAINLPALTIPPSGSLARCAELSADAGMIEDIPIIRKSFGAISGLPDPAPETIYIVSALVATAAKRPDVVCPGDPVRDADGKIVGCRSLCRCD